jgi:23S rRNA (adenine2503-C2)-methyltransferase
MTVITAKKPIRQKGTEETAPQAGLFTRDGSLEGIGKTTKVDFKDLSREETIQWAKKIGIEPYRAGQIRQWVFGRHAESFEEMTNLSKELRAFLSSHAMISRLKILETEIDRDGTRKFLFGLEDESTVESVLIPERGHYTACISSQVGYAMGCKFCLTARQGFTRDLTSSEIVNQILHIRQVMKDPEELTNIVLMGMGEPLANYEAVKRAVKNMIAPDGLNFSRRRITLSTCGLIPEIERLGRELPVNLAVSLNAADDQTRNTLMPINRKHSLKELIGVLTRFPLPKGRRITFEYLLIKDVNDRVGDATKLAGLLTRIRAKINLIPFNRFAGCSFEVPEEGTVQAFRDELVKHHYTAIIRKSKGSDISAACGQLRSRR